MLKTKVVVAPGDEPLAYQTVLTHLRLDDPTPEEATLLRSMITSAREKAETISNRALMPQTVELYLDHFPSHPAYDRRSEGMLGFGGVSRFERTLLHDSHRENAIEIPLPPLRSVVSIKYIDQDGAEQTLPQNAYLVDDKREPAQIVPAYGQSWPQTRRVPNAVTIRVQCGYSEFLIASASRTGNVATIKTRLDHGFLVGTNVEVLDYATVFNGPAVIATAPDSKTVTFASVGVDVPEQGVATSLGHIALSGSAVPECARNAMLLMIAHAWENRQLFVAGNITEVPKSVDWLLDTIRVWGTDHA